MSIDIMCTQNELMRIFKLTNLPNIRNNELERKKQQQKPHSTTKYDIWLNLYKEINKKNNNNEWNNLLTTYMNA